MSKRSLAFGICVLLICSVFIPMSLGLDVKTTSIDASMVESKDNPFEDPATRLAHRLLRDNGFSLPWIEEGKQIDALFEAAGNALENPFKRANLEQGIMKKVMPIYE